MLKYLICIDFIHIYYSKLSNNKPNILVKSILLKIYIFLTIKVNVEICKF